MTPSDPTIRAWEAEYAPPSEGHAVVLDHAAASRFSVTNHGTPIHALMRVPSQADEKRLIEWARKNPRPPACEAFEAGPGPTRLLAELFERVQA